MRDNVLFVLNEDITDENILAVLAAIQSFESSAIIKKDSWNSVHKQDTVLDLHIYIVCPFKYVFIFVNCLSKLSGIYTDKAKLPQINYTYVSEISTAQAVKIAEATDKQIGIAFAILIGAEGNSLADVSNLVTEYTRRDWVLFPQHSLLAGIGKLDTIPFETPYSEHFSLEVRARMVFASKAVIGYSSFETYLGCCLQKPVLEIQLGNGLFKWSNRNYICITELNDEVLLKGIKQCLQSVTEESTRMGHVTSTVQDAQNSLELRQPLAE